MRRQNLLRGYVDEENVRRNPITGVILNQNRGVPENAQVFTENERRQEYCNTCIYSSMDVITFLLCIMVFLDQTEGEEKNPLDPAQVE